MEPIYVGSLNEGLPVLIAPRHLVRFRDREYAITQLGESWVIEVEGGKYFLTAGEDPRGQAFRFLQALPKNSIYPRTPGFVASPHSPLLVEVDGVIVRAHPAMLPRGQGAKTYINPRTGDRVATTKGPYWIFGARGRESSDCGSATGEQNLDDVKDLATIWLRSFE